MALANYTDLKAAVASWLARADLTTEIPDFILLTEARFNRTLRARQQQTRAQLNVTGEYVTLPTDFLEFKSGYLNTSPRRQLTYKSPETQTNDYSVDPTAWGSQTCYISIQGDSFRFAPIPAGTETATIDYWAKIPPLSLNATNWLLTAFPDAYLYGAIMQAAGRIQDDPRIPGVKALYDEVVASITDQDRRARWGAPGMAMRAV